MSAGLAIPGYQPASSHSGPASLILFPGQATLFPPPPFMSHVTTPAFSPLLTAAHLQPESNPQPVPSAAPTSPPKTCRGRKHKATKGSTEGPPTSRRNQHSEPQADPLLPAEQPTGSNVVMSTNTLLGDMSMLVQSDAPPTAPAVVNTATPLAAPQSAVPTSHTAPFRHDLPKKHSNKSKADNVLKFYKDVGSECQCLFCQYIKPIAICENTS